MLFFLLFAYGVFTSLSAPNNKNPALPHWLGGKWTPHGAFFTGTAAAWGILCVWVILLGCGYVAGILSDVFALSGVSSALTFFLFLQGILALQWEHAHPPKKESTEIKMPEFTLYRITSRNEGLMTQILMDPVCMSDQQITPLENIRQITQRTIGYAQKIQGLIIQPVEPDFFSLLDTAVRLIQKESSEQTEKAVMATDQRLVLEEQVKIQEDEIERLRKSQDMLSRENQALRTSSRLTGTNQNYSKMSKEELESVRQSIFNESKKLNHAINQLKTGDSGGRNRIAGSF